MTKTKKDNVLTDADVISSYLINKGIKVTVTNEVLNINLKYKEATKQSNLLDLVVSYLNNNNLTNIYLSSNSVVSDNELDIYISEI